MKLLACVGLVQVVSSFWSLVLGFFYFLPMFSAFTGVDRKKNLCLVVSLQHFKEDVCRYLGSLGVG